MSLLPDIRRTPIHADSIAMTDWPVDSVACLPRRVAGGHDDGIFFLAEESRPAQVPYRCLLPSELDNLLVPVALSASHVGWADPPRTRLDANRRKPRALPRCFAIQNQTTPAALDPDLLVRKLAASGVMITFFNDVEVTANNERAMAAQYFGTKGFFAGYDAKLDAPLSQKLSKAWQDGFAKLQTGRLDATELARAVAQADQNETPPTTQPRGDVLLTMWKQLLAR